MAEQRCVECDQFSEPYDEGLLLVGRDGAWQEWEPIVHPDYGFVFMYPPDGEKKPHPELLVDEAQAQELPHRNEVSWLCNNCFFASSWAKANMVEESAVDAEVDDFLDALSQEDGEDDG